MLILNLVKQEWKKSIRAQGFYKNLAVSIMLGFFALYMAVVLLFLGFSLNEILEKADNKLNPMELFNGAMLYLMLFGLAIRFLMQQLNTFNLPPYQVLPIKRSLLVNFLMLKPLTSPVNYFLLLVVIPFSIKSVVGYYGVSVAIRFVISFVFLIWFDSLMASFLKRKFGSGLLTGLIIILALAGIVALEYFKLFSLFHYSGILYNFIVLNPFGLILPLILVGLVFVLNKWFFSQNYYPENFNSKIKGDKTVATDLSFLNRFGVIGEIIGLELKLILRHKRTKSILYMSGFFLLYGLMFYTRKEYANSNGLLFFVAMFMTGLLMLMFGQWIISWDSSHFDSLMTKNIPVRTYLNANYYLLIAFNVICFVLTTPYFLFGMKIVYMHLAAFIFNMGVNIYLLLFFATYNTRKLDLSKSSAMNYQGTTYKNFLIVLPLMFLPMIIVGVLSSLASMNIALWTLTILGLLGILFRKQLITLCVNQFNRRKYLMAEGFREGE
ncbi:MAG: DUF5687 family protein [Paludibacter sp.]|nr:DUF5687 family protein [Paludibacter sp.]